MKVSGFSLLAVFMFLTSETVIEAAWGAKTTHEKEKARVVDTCSRRPLSFIENRGQLDESVKFYERSHGHETYFTADGIYFVLHENRGMPDRHEEARITDPDMDESIESTTVKLTPAGIGTAATIRPEERLEGKIHYFIGNDKTRWKTNIPTYRSLVYREAFAGVDVKFYGTKHQLEYDVIVQPGGDLSQVQFEYSGIEGLAVTKQGDLSVKVREGLVLKQKRPVVYQVIEGKRIARQGFFTLRQADGSPIAGSISGKKAELDSSAERPGQGTGQAYMYGFEVSSYDKRYPLIIDPVVVVYTVYLEIDNTGEDYGLGICIDSSSNTYVTGYTYTTSSFLPGYDPAVAAGGKYWVFVKKLSASGEDLYTAYLGGNNDSYGRGIAISSSGYVYLTGHTFASDFATENPYQGTKSSYNDAFVAQLNSSLNIVFSTYLGGSGRDFGQGIAVDASGNAYITGKTSSTNFPRKNALDSVYNGGNFDAFVTKLNSDGSDLAYSTYLGGGSDDSGEGIAVDSTSNAYITGWTYSTNFPMANAFQNALGGSSDAFITKVAANGGSLVYSTYLGKANSESAHGIALDSSGNAYVVGETNSSNFPTRNPTQGTFGGILDAFVTKLNSSGNDLVFSTFLGGSGSDSGYGIAVNSSGNAHVTGRTTSTNFPTSNAFQNSKDTYSAAFVSKLDDDGNSLVYSSYFLGNTGNDTGKGIAVDTLGNAYLTGFTELDGNKDSFVTKIGSSTAPAITVVSPNGGELLEGGDPKTIVWSYTGTPGSNVKIELLKGSVVSSIIIASTSTGSSGNGSYTWNIPSNQTSGSDYRVRITSTSNNAYRDISDHYFTITAAPPVADFTGTPVSGAAPLTVSFTDSSTGATSWSWNFGDNQTSTERNPQHTYTNTGTGSLSRDVTLTVSGPGGSNVKVRTNYIQVNPQPPQAEFTGNPLRGAAPLTVSFTNRSTGSINTWAWNFGDNSAENTETWSPTHTYDNSGSYTVTLTTTGPGGSDVETKSGYITVLPSAITIISPNGGESWPAGNYQTIRWNYTPDAEGDSVKIELYKGSTRKLTIASSLSIGSGGMGSYYWTIPYALTRDNDYKIRITSTTHSSYRDSSDAPFTISDPTHTAAFIASPTAGMSPLAVHFTDQSTGTISSWSWDFGDDQTSTLQNPDHTYTAQGRYTVKLTVEGGGGYADKTTEPGYIIARGITVTSPSGGESWTAGTTKTIRWTYVDAPGSRVRIDLLKGSSVAMTMATSAPLGSSGEGSFSWTILPTLQPAANYRVKVTSRTNAAYTDRGNYFTITAPVPPQADFTASVTSGSAPLTVQFTDTSTGTVTKWAWNFGDGTTSTQQNPQHRYTTAGTYTVKLTAKGPAGSDTETKTGFIHVTASSQF